LPRKAEQKRLEVLKTADEYEAAIKYYESVRIRFLRRG
jgi:hypothetical protein